MNFLAGTNLKVCTDFKAGTDLKACTNFKAGTNFKDGTTNFECGKASKGVPASNWYKPQSLYTNLIETVNRWCQRKTAT